MTTALTEFGQKSELPIPAELHLSYPLEIMSAAHIVKFNDGRTFRIQMGVDHYGSEEGWRVFRRILNDSECDYVESGYKGATETLIAEFVDGDKTPEEIFSDLRQFDIAMANQEPDVIAEIMSRFYLGGDIQSIERIHPSNTRNFYGRLLFPEESRQDSFQPKFAERHNPTKNPTPEHYSTSIFEQIDPDIPGGTYLTRRVTDRGHDLIQGWSAWEEETYEDNGVQTCIRTCISARESVNEMDILLAEFERDQIKVRVRPRKSILPVLGPDASLTSDLDGVKSIEGPASRLPAIFRRPSQDVEAADLTFDGYYEPPERRAGATADLDEASKQKTPTVEQALHALDGRQLARHTHYQFDTLLTQLHAALEAEGQMHVFHTPPSEISGHLAHPRHRGHIRQQQKPDQVISTEIFLHDQWTPECSGQQEFNDSLSWYEAHYYADTQDWALVQCSRLPKRHSWGGFVGAWQEAPFDDDKVWEDFRRIPNQGYDLPTIRKVLAEKETEMRETTDIEWKNGYDIVISRGKQSVYTEAGLVDNHYSRFAKIEQRGLVLRPNDLDHS